MGEQAKPSGPDLARGVPITSVKQGGSLVGQVDGEAVLLVRRGDEWFAIGATCSHYSGPLAEGLVVGDTVRCPWHHACFSLRTGEALRPPALNAVACWQVERAGDKVVVTGKARSRTPARPRRRTAAPDSVVIVGAGAAGTAAAEMLRREGYEGRSRSWIPTPTRPTTGPTSPRTISRATRRRSGFRCARRTSTASTASSCVRGAG